MIYYEHKIVFLEDYFRTSLLSYKRTVTLGEVQENYIITNLKILSILYHCINQSNSVNLHKN